jgi:hypothetical protein
MSKITHAFAVALIFEVSGEGRVAEYCLEPGIALTPARFVHCDAMGELVALQDEVYSIVAVRAAMPVQLRML